MTIIGAITQRSIKRRTRRSSSTDTSTRGPSATTWAARSTCVGGGCDVDGPSFRASALASSMCSPVIPRSALISLVSITSRFFA